MLARDQFAKTGDWLFRWRSYLPLVFIVFVILPAFQDFSYLQNSYGYHLAWELFCLGISLFGFMIRCYTIGHIPEDTSGRNSKCQLAGTLNTTGIYSIIRNPLYLGNFFMILGVTMYLHQFWVCTTYMLAFWLYYERIILAEEKFLQNRFGEEYENYAANTPVFIPNFRLWRAPDLGFSLRIVLKREYSGFLAVIAIYTLLEFASSYVLYGEITFDPLWACLFCFALMVFIVLRTLKKKTRLLLVDGR